MCVDRHAFKSALTLSPNLIYKFQAPEAHSLKLGCIEERTAVFQPEGFGLFGSEALGCTCSNPPARPFGDQA